LIRPDGAGSISSSHSRTLVKKGGCFNLIILSPEFYLAQHSKLEISDERNIMRTFFLGLALACAACCIPGAAVLTQPARATTLVVSNNSDLVNGDTSSPAALIANPGPDGISLREAILAVNNVSGPNTITFAPALAGQTISPGLGMLITSDGVTIAGLVDNSGQPTVTIDASRMSAGEAILLFVTASDFTLTSLRFVGIQSSPNAGFVVFIRAGAVFTLPGKPHVSDITIRGNVFSNNPGLTRGGNFISLGMESSASGAILSNITIANNTFVHFEGNSNGILVQAGGTNNIVQDLAIIGNSYSDITFPVELVCADALGSRIVRSRIIGNSFDTSLQPVNLNHIGTDGRAATSGNLIDDTLVARNVFTNNRGPDVVLLGGMTNATGNTTANTQVINNLMTGSTQFGGVSVVGGRGGGTQNAIQGVAVVNDTIASNNGGIDVNPNIGTSGNTVSGVSVSNTILWGNPNGSDFFGVAPAQVQYSITAQSGFAGINHNIGSDPMFVNLAQGDFHLQPGSPAIGAGASTGAPFGDLECKVRASPPAIGAYEPGNQPSCIQIVPVAAVLPGSRSVQVGVAATAFGVIINTGNAVAKACGLAPATSLPASFGFQTTDPKTNQLTGTPNTPVDVNAGALQTFVFGIVPSAAFAPTDVALAFTCANTLDAPVHVGTNTLLLSASTTPVPDLIAIGATPSNDGIVNIPGTAGTGFLATAAVNIGAAATITASADDGGAGLPVNLSICQTNPSTGQCTNPATPGPSATVAVANNQTVTFTVFVKGAGTVLFDPANNRLFLRLKDAGALTRGATSAAVRTQ
jgi:hypothetical protein